MDLVISENVRIPEREIECSRIRAQGPGGQNVNKVATGVHLRFDINSSSLPEVAGDAAHLVPPDDSDALAAALNEILTKRDLRTQLSSRGPQRARLFTWPVAARLTAQTYAHALGLDER